MDLKDVVNRHDAEQQVKCHAQPSHPLTEVHHPPYCKDKIFISFNPASQQQSVIFPLSDQNLSVVYQCSLGNHIGPRFRHSHGSTGVGAIIKVKSCVHVLNHVMKTAKSLPQTLASVAEQPQSGRRQEVSVPGV